MTRPRSQLPILLVVVGIALAGALIWWIGGEKTGREESDAAVPGAAAPEIADPAERAKADLVAAPMEEELREGELRATESPESASRNSVDTTAVDFWDGENAGSIRGRVVLPALAPADETLEVLALASPQTLQLLHSDGGLFAASSGVLGGNKAAQVWSRAPVAADGSFELSFPKASETVHVALRGRFLYLDGTQPVEGGDQDAVLEAKLGGMVSGTVTLGVSDRDVSELEGTKIQLKTDELSTILGGGMGLGQITNPQEFLFQRHVELDADGRFEFLGVQPAEHIKIVVQPEELAYAEVSDLTIEAGRVVEVTARATLGATLFGRVADPDGNPIAEANVSAHRTLTTFGTRVPGEKMREATTDEQGVFELSGIMPGEIRLMTSHDEFINGAGDDFEANEGQRLEVTVTLDKGKRIEGNVFLPDGTPAAQARVQVERDITDFMTAGFDAMKGGREGEATADADGHFSIKALADATFKLRATWQADDAEEAVYMRTMKAVQSGADPVRVNLDPPVVVRGRVIDEFGEPVQTFTIRARQRTDMPFLPTAEREREEFESEDGSFVWGELHGGVWTLEADAEGFSTSEPLELELPDPSEAPIEFILPRTARVRGIVLTPDGAPAVGADITLDLDMMANLMRTLGQSESPSAESDEEGLFEIEIPPGDQALVATHTGWADATPVAVSVASSEVLEDVTIQLRRGALLTGEVYDKEGKLAPGLQIILTRPTGSGQRFAQSDRDGFFTFERVTPGDWQLVAMVGDMTAQGSEDFDMGKMMSNMHIAMLSIEEGGERHVLLGAPPENPVLVSGEVRAAGDPVDGVIISFFPSDGRGEAMSGLAMTQADEQGHFEIELDEPGKYVLNVQKVENMSGQQQSVEFREEIPAADKHHLKIEMPGGAIRGRVQDAKGAPAANVRVSLTSSDGFAYGSLFGGQYADVRTDDEGRYELVYLREGTYSVGAGGSFLGGAFGDDSAGGRVVQSGIRVQEGKGVDGVDFRLEAAGKIQGIVRDTSGKPVADTTIFLRDEDGALLELFSMVVSDGGGKFNCSGIAPGNYVVAAQADQLVSTGATEVRVKSLETSTVEVTVDTGTTLLVTLVDRTGAEVEATIRVKGPDGREWTGMMSMSRLMELMGSGLEAAEQRVGPLPPGTYEVRAIAADGRETKKKVTLSGQPERKVRLRLRD